MNRRELETSPYFPFANFRGSDPEFLLLELYWPAVIRAAIGEEVSAKVVPLAEADQDEGEFGTPTLISFWIPQVGRGVRVLYNDPPDEAQSHARLFASAAVYERPPHWDLPTAGQVDGPVYRMEELVFIADTDPAVADDVAEAARLFLTTAIPLDEMQDVCAKLEAKWLLR